MTKQHRHGERMTTTAAARPKQSAIFEKSPWSTKHDHPVPAKTVTVQVTKEHVGQAYWRQYCDPISVAMTEILKEDACVQVFWNSDSFAPRYHDDARIGIYMESQDEEGNYSDTRYWLPLPTRAARSTWKLRSKGIEEWEPLTFKFKLPAAALK